MNASISESNRNLTAIRLELELVTNGTVCNQDTFIRVNISCW